MSIQQQADAILAKSIMVVCDGWTTPRHERIILVFGNPAIISHGMCEACSAIWTKTQWDLERERS